MVTLNQKKFYQVFKPMELIFTSGEEGLHCLQEYFRKQTGREDV